MGLKMFKLEGIEEELFLNMNKNIKTAQLEKKHSFTRMAKAIDLLAEASDILEQHNMVTESELVLNVLKSFADDYKG